MKKTVSIILTVLVLTASVLGITASAKADPSLMLAADYDEEAGTLTVLYRLADMAGLESGDFALKYDAESLELTGYQSAKIPNTQMVVTDSEENPGTVEMRFIDMYCVSEDDCIEDGSGTLALFNFKVKAKNTNISLIAICPDCYLDPDSREISPERVTMPIDLTGGSKQFYSRNGYDFAELLKGFKGNDEEKPENIDNAANGEETKSKSSAVKKVIIAAAVTAAAFVIILICVVVKYRKADSPENGNDEKNGEQD